MEINMLINTVIGEKYLINPTSPVISLDSRLLGWHMTFNHEESFPKWVRFPPIQAGLRANIPHPVSISIKIHKVEITCFAVIVDSER